MSPACTAILEQSGSALQLELQLHLASGECAPDEAAEDARRLLSIVGAELYGLAWLTATPPSGPCFSFEHRWSQMPLHCAVVDRLALLVRWLIHEGFGGDHGIDEDGAEHASYG